MNLTISVADEVLKKAREVARSQGTSVQELLRRYLSSLAGQRAGEEVAEELLQLMKQSGGRSGGVKFRRDEVYEDRT